MELRQHEIDFADEVAKRVAGHLKQIEIPAQVEGGARSVTLVALELAEGRAEQEAAEGEDEHVCLDADDCHYVRAAQAHEQELTQALTEAGEGLKAAVAEIDAARLERDKLQAGALALVAAHKAAFDMFNRLAPTSDGQMAMYPLSLRHLQSFRVLQARVDDLVRELNT